MMASTAFSDFSALKVMDMHGYLKRKGIAVTNAKKQHMIKLCATVQMLNLPDDPDMCGGNPTSAEELLQEYGIKDPFHIQGLSNEFANVPTFSLYDVFNYLLYTRKTANYDYRKLKAYKSCENYRLFYDVYVENLKMKDLINDVSVFKSSVKPTQKDKTYLNKTTYDVWVIMGKSGDVKAAYCVLVVKYIADGECRHIGATLYAIEAFEVKSVTDGDNLWMKRLRHPVPIKQLKIMKARYSSVNHSIQEVYNAQEFDPRTPDLRECYSESRLKSITMELKKISQALDILEDPSIATDENIPGTDCDKCNYLSIISKVQSKESLSLADSKEFLHSVSLCHEDILHVESCTVGQSSDRKWFELRKGRITASNFSKVCKAVENFRCPPSLLKTLLGKYHLSDCDIPSLEWGRKKEKTLYI